MNAPDLLRQTLPMISAARARERPRLGKLLCSARALEPGELAAALNLQARTGARLGDLLSANGWSSEGAISAAIARQRGIGWVDLAARPPDPMLLHVHEGPLYLAAGILPWRRAGGVVTYAIVDPATAGAALARIGRRPGLACFVVTSRRGLELAVAAAFGDALAVRAAGRLPARYSVRAITRLRYRAMLTMLALSTVVAFGGVWGIGTCLILLFAVNATSTAVRLLAILAGRNRADVPGPVPIGAVSLAVHRPLPRISLLVPLYREGGMVPGLLRALTALDYPRERLEVRLLLEEDDLATREAVEGAALPAWIVPMVVPPGEPRTKPRALNFALDFCRGDIVGIYDAEDRPEPGQLRAVAARLGTEPAEVACVQCQLSYYNAFDNWLSRCFQIEYAIWFEVLLRGWQELRLPIPLGGTSVFFRRSALVAIGGWDAHNVTEDADLGMRLNRAGLRCSVLRSTTFEEANCRIGPWIRQRSRWLKGYMLTWLSHMRSPRALYREMGARGMFGLNLLFLGAATAYLAMPLFWAAAISWAITGTTAWHGALPDWVVVPALVSLALGQAVMLGCAALALVRRDVPRLMWWVPTLPIYWTLGALAAWKAVFELFFAPFFWDKTEHGLTGA